jgi:hypothetical protein
MSRDAKEFHMPEGPWIEDDSGVRGIWSQVLSQDPDSVDTTALLRYEPGVDTTAIGVRVHDYWEEVHILEGELTDLRLDQTFTRGMYAFRPPGMPHGPWRTRTGVLMLEIRRHVCR